MNKKLKFYTTKCINDLSGDKEYVKLPNSEK